MTGAGALVGCMSVRDINKAESFEGEIGEKNEISR